MTMPLMLFSAGLGTRMGALVRDNAKPMINVAGRPLIGHALDIADEAGVQTRVANTHYKPQSLTRYLQTRDVTVSREADRLLDTGGGLKRALPLLGAGPVMTMNTDAVWHGANPIAELRRAWRPEMTALLLVVPFPQTVGRKGDGDFTMDQCRRLSRGGNLVYSGLQILDPGLVAERTDDVFSLGSIWDALAAKGALFGVSYTGRWADVGYPEAIPMAEAMLADV